VSDGLVIVLGAVFLTCSALALLVSEIRGDGQDDE